MSKREARAALTPLVRWEEERAFYGATMHERLRERYRRSPKSVKQVNKTVDDAVHYRVEGLIQAAPQPGLDIEQ